MLNNGSSAALSTAAPRKLRRLYLAKNKLPPLNRARLAVLATTL
jgi:hypothetical protein